MLPAKPAMVDMESTDPSESGEVQQDDLGVDYALKEPSTYDAESDGNVNVFQADA